MDIIVIGQTTGVVSSAKNAKSVLTKIKGTVSDFGTASAAFAKAFGKTYVEES
ncbi:NAD+--asparagine ADP-ribosyltransferase [Clostridium acetobutylicum]|uniref:hypothetical protein n=1 Tax=Clostridium TaxID=1485 RepID=UPI000200C417|nr:MULTISPECIES: hypothetical protein [Clostridium]ADZ22744.1 conserved hypothetical protein [Clostridium acetobutylicum EA 2018]AEI32999.1 conserved hypothetical protein [Clostridium acetobutylicum DSM 1731]MBC2393971.1 hypothetical protein [Clostridium acetobutylicum]MBC2585500.1 hypothetical protein [Clostridium acetobutylicum]NOV87229.1 NAD+--asparagine ADP-ribosyltransferase [Clostridium acetobutylicum]